MTDVDRMITCMEMRLGSLPEAAEMLRLLEELRRRREADTRPTTPPTPGGLGLLLRRAGE